MAQLIGYIRKGYVWIVGENLRWTTGDTNTPGHVVDAWLKSPEHRANMLKAKFQSLGVAATYGVPVDPSMTDGMTVTSEYGFREN
jgi:uncharacterized protein YkwD